MTIITKPDTMVSGHVFSETGSVLGGAKIDCNGRRIITLFDGTFEFKGLELGTYTITAGLKGFKSQTKKVTVEKEGITAVDFELPEAIGTAKISGTVYDAEIKKPISSSGTVILILSIANKYAHLDGHGYFEFDNLAGDSYELVTSISGYEDKRRKVDIDEEEKKILNFYCKPIMLAEPPWG